MEPVVNQFRTSLGGFNRRDVQQYIEQSAAAHRKEAAALREQLAQAEKQRVGLESTLVGLESEKSDVMAAEARVRESLEESVKTLAKLRSEQSETETKLMVARQELDRLRAQVTELVPLADSYVQLKDRVAAVELEAQEKARGIIDEAQTEADRLRADARNLLEEILTWYDGLRRGMNTMMGHVQALNEIAEQTGALDEKARQLREQGGLK